MPRAVLTRRLHRRLLKLSGAAEQLESAGADCFGAVCAEAPRPIAQGARVTAIDRRVAFQAEAEGAALERLAHRRVVGFLGSNQTARGVAWEPCSRDGRTPTPAGGGTE